MQETITLADSSPYRGAGTTNIDATVLAYLRKKTTYPPVVLSNITNSADTVLSPQAPRETGTNLALGYHYDALDFIVDRYAVTNATLTVTNGTAIACLDNGLGIWLQDSSAIVSIGSPSAPNWFTMYQTVQEQSMTIGTNGLSPYYVESWAYGTNHANGTFQFSKFSGSSGGQLINADPASYNSLLVQECEFWAGGITLSGSTNPGATTVIDNNLFARSTPQIVVPADASVAFSNNLVWCAQFDFKNMSGGTLSAFNNIFDTCSLIVRGGTAISNGYNAYLNSTNSLSPSTGTDLTSGSGLAYESGPLGDFYQPAGDSLFHEGSTNASLLGLYEYTTQTNQVKEGTNIVSIGYHYVATDTNGQPASTLWLGIPDYLVDTNGDGVTNLVAWQLEYFGYTGLNPYADPYNEGTNLLQDYRSGVDLTQISFTAEAPKQYINTNSTPVSLAVSQGIPQYAAVLVDDTNLSDAVWTAYSPSFVVNFGTNQGMHTIWVGLKALPPSAGQTWHMVKVTLDTIAPTLTVFEPATNVVSVPLIQIQGFGNEQLSSVTFDVANGTGILTNQTAYIGALEFDTNLLAFSINYFQCHASVLLTPGTNTVTIHGADLAGNISTTNINVTLDYSGDTTPPAITVLWPTNGAKVGGSQFTLEAQVDDLTAQVTASNNGTVVTGQVQRNGQVRGLTLPLTAGTNTVVLTATDPAGNLSTNSLSVIQSIISVSVDQLPTNQLSQPSATVTGSVSDSTELVFVNGVQATVAGTSWTATNVPVNIIGMAKLNVQTFPDGADPASAPPDSEQQAYQQQPPTVRIQALVDNTYQWDYSYDPVDTSFEIEYWANASYETNFSIDDGSISDFVVSSSTNGWSDLGPWDWFYSDYADIDHFYPDGILYEVEFSDTRVVLDTGGEGAPGTTQIYAVYAAMVDIDGFALPPEQFMVQGHTLANTGILSSNIPGWIVGNPVLGVTFISVPAGTTPDITPTAASNEVAKVPTDAYYGATGQYFNFAVYAVPVNLQLTVDANRDGQISFDGSDMTTAINPWRFWINDSSESGDQASGADSEIPGSSSPNFGNIAVNGRCDLINYFPIVLNFGSTLQDFPLTNGYSYHLTQPDVALQFVYTSLTLSNAFDYLTNYASR